MKFKSSSFPFRNLAVVLALLLLSGPPHAPPPTLSRPGLPRVGIFPNLDHKHEARQAFCDVQVLLDQPLLGCAVKNWGSVKALVR